jgi:hypothetical protein
VARGLSGEAASSDRTVAVTAIEHGNIVITVASLMQDSGPSPETGSMFVTKILGGPLGGETWEGMDWSAMLRHHAGAVSRIAEFVASELGRQPGESQ